MQIQFYPIDISYKVIANKPTILLFGRTTKGEQICVMDDSFLPYFWALPEKGKEEQVKDQIEKTKIDHKGNIISVLKTELEKKKYLGKDVTAIKIYTHYPQNVSTLRSHIKKIPGVKIVLEADIPFVRRYLIDKGITPLTLTTVEGKNFALKSRVPVIKAETISQEEVTLKEPKILAFDIETYSPARGRILAKENPIIMLGFYGKNFRKVFTWKRFKTSKNYIEFVNSEAELINKFKETIEQFKPDILTGYFSDGFDLPYIRMRAEKYKIPLDIGLDYSTFSTKKGRVSQIALTGIVHFDVFEFISRIFARTLETDNYDLNSVASELLGEKKKDVDISKLIDAWDSAPEKLGKFCEYNLHDAYLAFKLCEKIFPNASELVKIIGIPLFDINRMGFSHLVEWYLIKQSKNNNELCPNKPTHDEIKQRRMQTYKGAFVYEPEPGLYKDIVICDFRSLYPTIIASHNISLETLNCDCCKDEAELAPLEHEKYWFCKKKKGLIASAIEDLIKRRMRVKEIMAQTKRKDKKYLLLDARQDALKVLANASYGYFAFFGARWYCIECAKSITAWGRHYIHKVISAAQQQGFNVIYSDTDSIFFTLDKKKKEDVKNFLDTVNMLLPSLMELEEEGFYPAGIFVSARLAPSGAKKKYALLTEDDSIKIKGFATVRSDWSLIARQTQEKVLEIILKKNQPEKALEYVRSVIHDLRNKKIPLEQVVVHTQLQKELDEYEQIGPHVAVARKMLSQGIPVGPGSMITFVIKEGSAMIRDRAEMPELCKQKDYDANYYINNQVIPAVEKIFEVLGYKKEDLLEHKEQKKLHKFFK